MTLVLTILFFIVLLVLGFLGWFFLIYVKVPPLNIPKEASTEEKFEILNSYLVSLHQSRKFNGAILIAKNREPLFMETYGYTDFSKQVELSAQSSFRLASLSKQFTAAGILILVAQQRLRLDDRVEEYLLGFPFKDVSIRHLLNQCSGFEDQYLNLAKKYKRDVGDLLSLSKAIELMIKYPPKVYAPPNSIYQYSNSNYILLAGIIEKITGFSFEEFMRQELFEPLNMKNTRVWNLFSLDKKFPNKTDSFEDAFGTCKPLKPSFIDGVAGDGGVFSSIEDFLIWDKFWDENPLIPQEIIAEAFLKPALTNGEQSNYGFGWLLTESGMVHDGSWLGARTFISRNIENKTCVVVLDNSSNLHFDHLMHQINKLSY